MTSGTTADGADARRQGELSPADPAEFAAQMLPKLVGLLTVRVGDQGVAEEIAQEALAKAWVWWDDVSTMANPSGWVYRVALNAAASRFRRMQAERRALRRLDRPVAVAPLIEPADRVIVRDALKLLSRRQLEAVVLRFYGGLSVNETADVMGVTTGTVKTLTSRALATLRKTLATDFDLGEDIDE